MAGILSRTGHALVSALTPDRYEQPLSGPQLIEDNPQSLHDYLMANLQAFDPRTPEGAFNLATILVPGAKGNIAGSMRFAAEGRATPAQESLLRAIYRSSRGQASRTGPLFNEDVSTGWLAAALGRPSTQRVPSELTMFRAENPLLALFRGGGQLGPYPVGKLPPGGIPLDRGGVRPSSLQAGMDVPPRPGTIEDYFPTATPRQQQVAAELLRILMEGRGKLD